MELAGFKTDLNLCKWLAYSGINGVNSIDYTSAPPIQFIA